MDTFNIVNEPQENYKTGFVSIFRSIKKHWIWNDSIKFKWWIDILLTVNHTDKKVNIGYEIIDCKRGQSIQSLQTWAKQFNCDKSKVRRFFDLLQKDKMICIESVQKTTRLTVLNYDSYQLYRNDSETIVKRKRNGSETKVTPNNNDNNDNNINIRQSEFKNEIKQFNQYDNELLKAFFMYWSEPTKDKTKMRKDLEKTWDTSRRLLTWFNRSKK